MPATIAWVSDGEQARPRRRRGRRRGRRSARPAESVAAHADDTPAPTETRKRQPSDRSRGPVRLRTVHETSAGGLVVDGLDDPHGSRVAALIGRVDRRGRMLWSLPKGHIEVGETAEQTAIREVAEETGIRGDVLASLGSIDYWFVTDDRRVHKTVHHYLLRFLGGELSEQDREVSEVAWVPLEELPSRLAYADERRLAGIAGELIDTLHTHGPGALPPLPQMAPWRRRQTHSHPRRQPERHRERPGPDRTESGRTNGSGPEQ